METENNKEHVGVAHTSKGDIPILGHISIEYSGTSVIVAMLEDGSFLINTQRKPGEEELKDPECPENIDMRVWVTRKTFILLCAMVPSAATCFGVDWSQEFETLVDDNNSQIEYSGCADPERLGIPEES